MDKSRLKTGILEKYKTEGMRKSWKKYTFQVTSTYFLQIKEDMTKPQHMLLLSQVTKVVIPAKGGAGFPFEVHFQAKGMNSPWLLKASSNEERISWMDAIKPGSSRSLKHFTTAEVSPGPTSPENPYVMSPSPAQQQQQFQLSPAHTGAMQDNQPLSQSLSFREAAQRGSNREFDPTQSWPLYQQQPEEYLVPVSSPKQDPTQSLPIGMMGRLPEQQTVTDDHAARRSNKTYSHYPRPQVRPQLQKTPTFPEIRQPVDSQFAAAMSAQYKPQPAPRRTAQPNQQGQRYPPRPQPSQPRSNGHYDRPPPNPRPAYPEGQRYMPLQPIQPTDPNDNQYVIIDRQPQPQVPPSPGMTAQPQGNYTPLQPTPTPAAEGDEYMTLVSASARPQPRPRPAPRQQPQGSPHYMVLEGPTYPEQYAPPSASNQSQSLSDTQRNYVAPDSPAEMVADHEYVDPDTMDRSTTNTFPPVDSRNYIEPNPPPMVDGRNYVEPDSGPLRDRGNDVAATHPGPPVEPRIHVTPGDDLPSPVDDRNYIFQEAIGSQPRPQPRQAPPSPRPRRGKLAASGGAHGADVHKMIENFSPSQVDMLMQMLQKVQVQTQTQTQEDVEAAWGTSPQNPLYDSRAPVAHYEVDASHTNQRNLQRLTKCLSQAPVLAENILVTDDDDPESYEARPEWAKAVTVPQGSDLDSLAALEQEALFIPRDQLDNFEQIGEGQFGKVFKAALSRGEQCIPVAVKTTKKSTSEADKASFLKEMSVMSQMMHPNIVRLYGLVQEDVPAPWIVLEYLPHGDLKHFLMKNERPVEKLMKYMIDVAMGMHYISERGLVHRDLAARNILVGDGELCKVADFGLLRELPKDDSIYHSQTDVPCPIRWMPPESISDRRFSTASDVWSFGILIWEMFNPGKQPYDNLRNLECVTKVAQGYRLPSPRGCPRLLARIMKACWHEKPEKRPSFLLISTLLSTKATFNN